jgi:glycosyltransferase involved in cell wall biosynthesis
VLSILIPIYNYQVLNLVQKLHQLAVNEGIEFEIICIDDASTFELPDNKLLSNLQNVYYQQLNNNIGRSALRNLLASKARYEYLLFIDTDMEVVSDSFLHKYLEEAPNYDVQFGGIKYEDELRDRQFVLRWKYGKEREALSPEIRSKDASFSVKTCNLFIRKQVFNVIKFNEQIREYGHEDTLFSFNLAKLNVRILHLNNPLLHLGLEDATNYLRKVELANKSLSFIAANYLTEEQQNHIRLLHFYRRINKMGLMWFLKLFYRLMEKSIVSNLHSDNPSMLYLDLYKLISYEKHQQH